MLGADGLYGEGTNFRGIEVVPSSECKDTKLVISGGVSAEAFVVIFCVMGEIRQASQSLQFWQHLSRAKQPPICLQRH